MALIENYIRKDDIIWQSLFQHWHFRKEYESDTELKPKIDFLCERASFWYYKDLFSENPFSPFGNFTVSGGGRTVDITDLNENDCVQIENCINYTEHNLILGFLYDILGLLRKNNENKLTAAKYLIEYAKELLNNEKHFGLLLSPIERAFALLIRLKKQIEIQSLIKFIFTDPQLSQHQNEYPIKVSLLETIHKKSPKPQNDILSYAEKLYEKYAPCKEYLNYSICLLKTINKIYKGQKENHISKNWATIYAEKCCEVDIYSPDIEEYIDYAIEIMDKADEFNWTNKLRIKKKQLQEDFYQSFNMQTIPIIPSDQDEAVKGNLDNIIEKMKISDGFEQFVFFLYHFIPLPQKEIKKLLEKKDHNFLNEFGNLICFNDKNEIIYQSSHASQEKKLEYETYQIYEWYGNIIYNLLINQFIYYVKFDDGLKNFVKEIVNHNELISKNHKIIFEYISKGINEKRIRPALAGLLPQFEGGLRDYFEKNRIVPAIRSNGKEVKASLGQMLNHKDFRKLIDALIGTDLAQYIDYMACKEFSNLRNEYAHEGYGDDGKFTIDEIMLFFLLIKAYCMGYDAEVNINCNK